MSSVMVYQKASMGPGVIAPGKIAVPAALETTALASMGPGVIAPGKELPPFWGVTRTFASMGPGVIAPGKSGSPGIVLALISLQWGRE